MLRILFATSEIYPLMKTGGLADVSDSLPRTLDALQHDVRIVMPAYQDSLAQLDQPLPVASLVIKQRKITIYQSQLPGSTVVVWLVDDPPYFDRPGNPYLNRAGKPWADNAARFLLFCRTIVEIAANRSGLDWRPDVVHCNDWQTGLAPALLSHEKKPPATVFTIHNLAYQGLFPYSTFKALRLPKKFWHFNALEFFYQLSFIKGGLNFADQLSTVSPRYAEEIQTEKFGCGLQGLLQHRQHDLTGILNGIDTGTWNPETDPHVVRNYCVHTLDQKQSNKADLQKRYGLTRDPNIPLIGFIGRLVQQKGLDLILQTLQHLSELDLQMIFLGTGDAQFEQGLGDWAQRYPEKFSVTIGYDEQFAHRIEAGSDCFIMPSRFEPCGLNQMYSQRYGTIPLVHRVGGLADSVVDTTHNTLGNGSATGLVFDGESSGAFAEAIKRSLLLYENKTYWVQMQKTGMVQDFSWAKSAEQYLSLYQTAINKNKSDIVKTALNR